MIAEKNVFTMGGAVKVVMSRIVLGATIIVGLSTLAIAEVQSRDIACKIDSDCKIAMGIIGCCVHVRLSPEGTILPGTFHRDTRSCSIKDYLCPSTGTQFARAAFCKDSKCYLDKNVRDKTDCIKGIGSYEYCLSRVPPPKNAAETGK